jgi:hypothetical protein
VERVLERISERRDHRRPPWHYEVEPAFEQEVHGLIGAPWPCEEEGRFDEVWKAALGELTARGLAVGRGSYGGWDDADPRLGHGAWCLVRHLEPQRVVETGVARGLTTRVVIEALESNGAGHLWSVDLPPLLERHLAEETAAAVPERLYERWTLLHGSSRRRLPELLGDLREIDLFLHDSMHTTRNLGFELEQVWPVLRPGGVVLIDDVEKNVATGRFLRAHPETASVIAPSDDGEVLLACIVKPDRAAHAAAG